MRVESARAPSATRCQSLTIRISYNLNRFRQPSGLSEISDYYRFKNSTLASGPLASKRARLGATEDGLFFGRFSKWSAQEDTSERFQSENRMCYMQGKPIHISSDISSDTYTSTDTPCKMRRRKAFLQAMHFNRSKMRWLSSPQASEGGHG